VKEQILNHFFAMATSLLERTRAAQEDIELFERAIVQVLLDDAKTHRDNINHSHWVNTFADKIQDRSKSLAKTYKDEDGSRASEISSMGGKGAQLFSDFYEQLRQVKDYHRKFPNVVQDRPEAEQMLNTMDIESLVSFTGEEGHGRYLDLHAHHDRYQNLQGIEKPERVDYLTYLDSFGQFKDRSIVKNAAYKQYLSDLVDYLRTFFRRSQPLFALDQTVKQFEADFNTEWANGSFVPVGFTDAERERESNPLWDKYSQKLFTNENAFKGYKNGKKYEKNVQWYNSTFKEIMLLENKVNRLVGLLSDVIDATKVNVERKMARTAQEQEAEVEDEESDLELEEEEEEVKLTKQNYPTDWSGNPIPYWLYKLHGLGIEYKCEICGNMSYWGRRAFEKHFSEWRHNHGLKCLRIEYSKEFNEVTKIADALELAKALKENKVKDMWNDEVMEEYEDSDGNVLNKKTYRDLAAQGLL
jgi:splicing factor 3A subunit 3